MSFFLGGKDNFKCNFHLSSRVCSSSIRVCVAYFKLDLPPLPLPGFSTSAFAHRNPPRSLWLQHIHRMCCLTRRARPLKEGQFSTKCNRRSWGNTDAIDFVAIASSLQATNGIRGICNTNRLKAVPLRFVRQAWPTTRRRRLYYAHKGSRTAKTSELVLAYQR